MSYANIRLEPLGQTYPTGLGGLFPDGVTVMRRSWINYPNVVAPDGVVTLQPGQWGYYFSLLGAAYSGYTSGVGHYIVLRLSTYSPGMAEAADGVPDMTITIPDYPALSTASADYAVAVDNGALVQYTWRWDFPSEDRPRGIWNPANTLRHHYDVQINVDDGQGGAPDFPPPEVCSEFWTTLVNTVAEASCVSEEPPPDIELLEGVAVYTGGGVDISSGVYPAVYSMFDYRTLNITHLYQPFDVYDDIEETSYDMKLGAIDGDYAIMVERTAFGSTRYAAIVPYNQDANIVQSATWESQQLVAGTSVTLIDCGPNYQPRDVVMIARGQFTLQGIPGFGLTVVDVPIITYTSPTDYTVTNLNIDVVALGYADITFSMSESEPVNIAVEASTRTAAIRIRCYGDIGSGEDFVYLAILFDPDTGTILDHVASMSAIPPTIVFPGATTVSDDTLWLTYGSTYYDRVEGWANGFHPRGITDYGVYVAYQTYTSLDATTGDATGLSADTQLDAQTLVAARLTALGFTPGLDNKLTDPSFFMI